MAKKKKDGQDLPPRFEIISRPSMSKIIKEQDNRVQWTGAATMIISFALVCSVCFNVYQSISSGGFILFAQDIRTADLTYLAPLPKDKQMRSAQIGKFPHYTDEFLARLDREKKENEDFFNSLYTIDGMNEQVRVINAGVAAMANSKAAPAPTAGDGPNSPAGDVSEPVPDSAATASTGQ